MQEGKILHPKRQSKSDQFSKEDCFATMRFANVRIHVEGAIRRIKGWHIFDGLIPLTLWSCQSTLSSELFAS